MTPIAAKLFMSEIMPRILATVPRRVHPVGAEDIEEISQDALAIAAAMLDSAEAHGKPMLPASITWFAIQTAKTGRRSTCASRTDVMSSATQLDGQAAVISLDAPVTAVADGDDEDLCLHDVLADTLHDDPSTAAARNIDWDQLSEHMDDRQQHIVHATATGRSVKETADELGITPPRVVQLKRAVAKGIAEAWGDDILEDIQRPPQWRKSVRTRDEGRRCRFERIAAAN